MFGSQHVRAAHHFVPTVFEAYQVTPRVRSFFLYPGYDALHCGVDLRLGRRAVKHGPLRRVNAKHEWFKYLDLVTPQHIPCRPASGLADSE